MKKITDPEARRAGIYPGKLTETELLLERERLDALLESGGATSKDLRRKQQVEEILGEFATARGSA